MTKKTLPEDWKEKVEYYLDTRRPPEDSYAFTLFANEENTNRLLETDEVARAAKYIWGAMATKPEVQQKFHKIIGDALSCLSQALTVTSYRFAGRTRKAWREIAEALETVRDDGLFFRDNYSPPHLGFPVPDFTVLGFPGQEIDPKTKRRYQDIMEKINYAYKVRRDTLNDAISYYRKQAEDAITKTRPKDPGPSDTLFNLLGLCRTWGFEGRVRNEVVMLFINAGAKAFPSVFARINKRTISARASEIKKNPWHWRE